ncbi:MAG: hypothetical protein AB1796_13660 [Bacillota bacterium]
MNGKQNWEKLYFWRGLGLFLAFLCIIFGATAYLRHAHLEGDSLYRVHPGSDPYASVKEEERENNLPLNGEKKYFVGIHHEERLAIYEKSGDGRIILLELLPYLVKEVHYVELKKGIYFSTEEEKESILEYLTS